MIIELCCCLLKFMRKKILCCPHSICGYYDGHHFCSYFAGFLFLIRCVQSCDFTQDHFENSLPSNHIDFQNKITLIENVGAINKRENARKRKSKENEILLHNEC